jgi:molecular chaperone HscB
MIDFFAFLDIPRAFFPDEGRIRATYLANSRQWHPDVHTRGLEGSRDKAEELAGINNQAFTTLMHFDWRLEHLLALEGFLPEEGQAQLPQDFLMEMMDFNEELMELEMADDPGKRQELASRLDGMEDALMASVKPIMANYDRDGSGDLQLVCDYLLKRRYFQRLGKSLEGRVER